MKTQKPMPSFASNAEKRRWEMHQVKKELAQAKAIEQEQLRIRQEFSQKLVEELTQEQLRIKHGLQCPECFGVNVTANETRYIANFQGFTCQDCGCEWGK